MKHSAGESIGRRIPLSRGEQVKDTSPAIERKFRAMLMKRSGEERRKWAVPCMRRPVSWPWRRSYRNIPVRARPKLSACFFSTFTAPNLSRTSASELPRLCGSREGQVFTLAVLAPVVGKSFHNACLGVKGLGSPISAGAGRVRSLLLLFSPASCRQVISQRLLGSKRAGVAH
jgi:hypothetical protein